MLRMVVIAIMVLVPRRRFELEQRVSNELARVNSMALGIVATVAASKMMASSARPPQQPRSCDLRRGHTISGKTRRHCQGTNSRRNEEESEPRPSRRPRGGRHDAANVKALALPFYGPAKQQRRPFGSGFAPSTNTQRPVSFAVPHANPAISATHSAVSCRDGALFTFARCHDECAAPEQFERRSVPTKQSPLDAGSRKLARTDERSLLDCRLRFLEESNHPVRFVRAACFRVRSQTTRTPARRERKKCDAMRNGSRIRGAWRDRAALAEK
jgi:hypothetical protein